MDMECPNCEKKALRERSSPSLKNIRLREVGSSHAPVVCDECGSTFNMEMERIDVETVDVEENEADGW